MKRRFKHALQWIGKRGSFFVAILFLGVAVLLLWFLNNAYTQTNTSVAIAIAAISAFFAAVSSVASLLQAVEIQRQRENQERPYVIVYFDATNRGGMYFIVENSGNSPAVDVLFEFTPVPIDFAGRPLNQVSLFQKPISFLPAGRIYRQIIDTSSKFLAEDRPTVYRVKTTYSSVYNEMYNENIEFDLSYLKQATLPGKSVEENLEDISKQLKDLYTLLNSAKGMNSLLIESPEQHQKRMERWAQETKRKVKAKRTKTTK